MQATDFAVPTPGSLTPFVRERFTLIRDTKKLLQSRTPNFGYNGFGELTFFRTYSRAKYAYQIAADDAAVSPTTNSWLTAKQWLKQATAAEPSVNWQITEKQIGQESWADCVIRVIEGVFSIRKDWYTKNHILWAERKWQAYAKEMSIMLFDMKWMPPGRGLWAMGTEFIFERGGLALQNCCYSSLGADLGEDLHWIMDCLMCGCGTGFSPLRSGLQLKGPVGTRTVVVEDSREGWCELIRDTVNAWIYGRPLPKPDYSKVRGHGLPIHGFGGISSGPGPLQELYAQVNKFCSWYLAGTVEAKVDGLVYDEVIFKTDLANCIGCCVVAGNCRRSAQLACAPISDSVFLNLKDFTKYPHREAHAWMSNNSAALETPEDFDMLGEIARRVIANGEPGYINRRNMPHGRIGKFEDQQKYGIRLDDAIGINPCGEMPQCEKEACNIAETLPTRCDSPEEWIEKSCEYATFYTSTVSLLLTHRPETNAVIVRNRRIGVGIVDFTGWKRQYGVAKVTRFMRQGYATVRRVNKALAAEAGVVESNRVTTIKPGGTTPKLAGRTSGIGHPNFEYMIRRIRIAKNSSVHAILVAAGIPHSPDQAELASQGVNYTDVFEFPLYAPGKPALQVSLWEQAMNLVLVQREWSDNACSNTLNFRPKWYTITRITGQSDQVTLPDGRLINVSDIPEIGLELGEYRIITKQQWGETAIHVQKFDPRHEEDDIEAVLSAIAPLTKSVSLLPHSPAGAYAQMPEEGITPQEYQRRCDAIRSIDWSLFCGSDGVDERYCTSDSCVIPT